MKGFAALELEEPALGKAVEIQNRLRDVITRQGVRFLSQERMHPVVATWPFGRESELTDAQEALQAGQFSAPTLEIVGLRCDPDVSRPAGVYLAIDGRNLQTAITSLQDALRPHLDLDVPQSLRVALVRVSPPSRKVGVALGSLLRELGEVHLGAWHPTRLGFYQSAPDGTIQKWGEVALREIP